MCLGIVGCSVSWVSIASTLHKCSQILKSWNSNQWTPGSPTGGRSVQSKETQTCCKTQAKIRLLITPDSKGAWLSQSHTCPWTPDAQARTRGTGLRSGYAYVSAEPNAPSFGRNHRACGRRAMSVSWVWPQGQASQQTVWGSWEVVAWRAREAGHSPGSSRGPGPAETCSRISPQATSSAGAAPAPGGSAPGPSAIAASVLAAAAAAVSHRACTPSCRRWYPGRKRRAPRPGTGH